MVRTPSSGAKKNLDVRCHLGCTGLDADAVHARHDLHAQVVLALDGGLQTALHRRRGIWFECRRSPRRRCGHLVVAADALGQDLEFDACFMSFLSEATKSGPLVFRRGPSARSWQTLLSKRHVGLEQGCSIPTPALPGSGCGSKRVGRCGATAGPKRLWRIRPPESAPCSPRASSQPASASSPLVRQ